MFWEDTESRGEPALQLQVCHPNLTFPVFRIPCFVTAAC